MSVAMLLTIVLVIVIAGILFPVIPIPQPYRNLLLIVFCVFLFFWITGGLGMHRYGWRY